MKDREIKTKFFEADSKNELNRDDQDLLQAAKVALKDAYSPYSNYQVGAAVRLENGKTFIGSNQENAAFPAGVCAERVALYAANAHYPDIPVTAIAISVHNAKNPQMAPGTPCGICRQAMVEIEARFKTSFKLILGGDGEKILIVPSAKELLPLAFNADFLKRL